MAEKNNKKESKDPAYKYIKPTFKGSDPAYKYINSESKDNDPAFKYINNYFIISNITYEKVDVIKASKKLIVKLCTCPKASK